MTTRDLLGLAASYIYATSLILAAEALRRALGVPQELTRKLVHIGAGMWVFGVLALFDSWQIGVLPFATFILVNYLFYRYRIFGAMDAADSPPGTVYFALAITLLFGLLWRPSGPVDRAPAAVAGAMALTWGDALAALVGRRWGRHRYRLGASGRSWEGSAMMFAASAVAMFLVLALLPGSSLSPLAQPIGMGRALSAALLGAGAAALAEAASPRGTDNLSVPLVAAGVALLIIS
jgi:phytol kinase